MKYSKVSGAGGYEIYYATGKNGKYKLAGKTNKTSYTIKNLKKGKTPAFLVTTYVLIQTIHDGEQ